MHFIAIGGTFGLSLEGLVGRGRASPGLAHSGLTSGVLLHGVPAGRAGVVAAHRKTALRFGPNER